ncbi:F-box/LRR-repeat protein at3g59200 [Phtheirospermum japonicum]|uniref:F-box/LRR-repeat protein at3g59200 n=1 Tax=Phtheirospermum japonicum TaxID=374723 RepID=A0A830DEX7_9LAMI|nr:F-box/LRR-repeat protein at3g59200 [Phtheirospermum japonicum]
MGGEVQLPEPLIQRIQYFLVGKEAARTTVLSKSWRNAWLTRPNLVFDETDFYPETHKCLEYAKKTIQRYGESNSKIESFKLCIRNEWSVSSDHVKEIILAALKLRATHLSFKLLRDFVLPNEVFGSENLVGLSVEGCNIDLGIMSQKVTRCSRLGSLCLYSVGIENHMISHIISSCPLIENLSLTDINDFYVGRRNAVL